MVVSRYTISEERSVAWDENSSLAVRQGNSIDARIEKDQDHKRV